MTATLATLEASYTTARETGDQDAIAAFNAAATEHAARIGADITTLVRMIADTYNAVHHGWTAATDAG